MPFNAWLPRKPKITRRKKAPTGNNDEPMSEALPDMNAPLSPEQVIKMQRLIGNQAVMRLVGTKKRASRPDSEEKDLETNEEFSPDKPQSPVLAAATPPPVQRKFPSIQRNVVDVDRLEVVQPSSSSGSELLAEMLRFATRAAEHSGNPDAIKGVYFLIVTDALYLYDHTGSLVEQFPFEPASENTTLLPPGYYHDSGGGSWRVYSATTWGKVGFHTLALKDAKNAQISQWISPESMEALQAGISKASDVFMAVTPAPAGDVTGEKGKGGTAGGSGTGKAKKLPPPWAKAQQKRIKEKLAAFGAGGKGQTGTGEGGGGTATTGQPEGKGTSAGEANPQYDPNPDRVTLWTKDDGRTFLNVWVGKSVKTVELQEGEADDSLLKRIQDAVLKLRMAADPSLSTKLSNGAAETGILPDAKSGSGAKDGIPGGTGTLKPDPERPIKAGQQVANARAYPAHIINYGADITVTGATNHFTMSLDYGIAGADVMSQFAGRMQPIEYYWELIDVTNVGVDKQKEKLQKTGAGEGGEISNYSGAEADLSRAWEGVKEDTAADIKDSEDWYGRSAYLGVVGVSNVIRMGGALISSGISLLSLPMAERSFSFAAEGEYIIRCTATPQPTDEALADPANHVIRESSVAVAPIKIMNINKRAQEAIDEVPPDVKQMKEALEKLPEDSPERDALLKQILTRETENTPQAIERQLKELEERFTVLAEMRDGLKANDLKQRSPAARLLYVQLEFMNQSATRYETDLKRTKEQILKVQKSATLMGAEISGDVARVKTILASEENGQVIQMLTMLGLSTKQPDNGVSYTFADVTSPATRDYYEGKSSSTTLEGHREAILNAFENFRANNGYGRGTLRIRTSVPVVLPDNSTSALEFDETLRSAPGTKKRVLQRLQDLATAAEIAGLILTGPAGMALGAIGGLAGGIVAGVGLANRARTGTLEWDFQTIMDITGLIGGALSLAQPVAMAASTVKKWEKRAQTVGKWLHFTGQGMMAGQILVVPLSLALEFAAIEKAAREQNLSPGEVAARRAEALLQAVRSNLITVISARGGLLDQGEMGGRSGAPSMNIPDTVIDGGGVHPTPTPDVPASPDVPHGVPVTPEVPVVPDLTSDINSLRNDGTNTAPDTESGLNIGNRPAIASESPTAPDTTTAPDTGTTPVPEPVSSLPEPGPTPAKRPKAVSPKLPAAADKKPDINLTAGNFGRRLEQVMFSPGEEGIVRENQIHIVGKGEMQALYELSRGSPMPEDMVAYYNAADGQFYIAKETMTAPMRQALVEALAKLLPSPVRLQLGMGMANAYVDRMLETMVHNGDDLPASSGQGDYTALMAHLEYDLGNRGTSLENVMAGGSLGDLRSSLAAYYGNTRGKLIEALIKAGKPQEALGLMSQTKSTLGNHFGDLFAAGVEDYFMVEAGGKPSNPARHKVIDDLAKLVGKDVLREALFGGDVQALQAKLDEVMGYAGADGLKAAFSDGRIADAHKMVADVTSGKPVELPATAEKPADTTPSAPDSKPKAPVEFPGGKAVTDLAAAVQKNAGADHSALAKLTLEEIKDFGKLRKMVEAGVFGKEKAQKESAKDALQKARAAIIKAVLEAVIRDIEPKYDKVKLTPRDLGTPGFNSDSDITMATEEKGASDTERVGASLEAVEAAYDYLNKAGMPPDKTLDCNFYSYMIEKNFKPGADASKGADHQATVTALAENCMKMSDAEWKDYRKKQLDGLDEAQSKTKNAALDEAEQIVNDHYGIVFDQSVISLAEMCMNMSKPDWEAYKKEQLKKLGKGSGSDGMQQKLEKEAQKHMKGMFQKAEVMVKSFGNISDPVAKSKKLTELRGKLRDMLAQNPPPSAREIRQVMGEIMLLEPDAYGTLVAVDSVVKTQQGMARAEGDDVGKKVNDIRDTRKASLDEMGAMGKAELMATLAQEASASLGKMFGHAHAAGGNTPKDAISMSKYLGRVYSAFSDAGLTMTDPLLDRVAALVGAKQEGDVAASALLEMRGWAQDTNRTGLSDSALVDTFILESQKIGQDMVTKLRAAEMTARVAQSWGI